MWFGVSLCGTGVCLFVYDMKHVYKKDLSNLE